MNLFFHCGKNVDDVMTAFSNCENIKLKVDIRNTGSRVEGFYQLVLSGNTHRRILNRCIKTHEAVVQLT